MEKYNTFKQHLLKRGLSRAFLFLAVGAFGLWQKSALAAPIIPLPSDTSLCGHDIILNAGAGRLLYQWSTGSNDSLITVTTPGSYSVTVTDTSGVSTLNINVTEGQIPVASLALSSTVSCDSIFVAFESLSTDAQTYLWQFGDGNSSLEENPTHGFSFGSSISVELIVYSAEQCADTVVFDSTLQTLDDVFSMEVPNVFTPNGDGVNDDIQLVPYGPIQACTQVRIYDRWGQKIYDNDGVNSSWDGHTFSGQPMAAGVYFYELETNGFTKKGHVTLVR